MDVAVGQSERITFLCAAIQDTALWDPSTGPRPSSCSTPNHQSSGAEVVVWGREKDRHWPSRLSLSNHYTGLSDEPLAHPADAPAVPTCPNLDLTQKIVSVNTVAFLPLVASGIAIPQWSQIRNIHPGQWPPFPVAGSWRWPCSYAQEVFLVLSWLQPSTISAYPSSTKLHHSKPGH